MKIEKAQPLDKDYVDSIIDHMMNALIVIDPDGMIKTVNRATLNLLGYTEDELAGRPIEFIFADDSPFKGIGPGVFESTYLSKDRRKIPVLISGSVMRSAAGQIQGIISLAQDITERKKSEEALQESQRVLSTLMGNLPGMAYRSKSDQAWTLEFASQGALELTGYSPDDLIGSKRISFAQLIHPDDLNHVRTEIGTALKENRSFQLIYRIIDKSGKEKWVWEQGTGVYTPTGEPVALEGFIIDITERKLSEERLQYLAHHDALTGLPNRALFLEHLRLALITAARHQRLVAVLFLDLDRFKLINDTLGHAVGDLLLKAVAERLTASLRRSDTVARLQNQSNTVARLGGDEFTLLLTDIAQTQDVPVIVQRIANAFIAPFIVEGHELFVTPSIGISLYPNDGENAEKLLRNADMALYRAKDQGRNNYQFYLPEMNVKVSERLAMENHLRRALEREELLLHYQPQVDLNTGRIIGMEALVRWHRPDSGLVSPAKFIPLAEETGLIIPLGEWVLRAACAQNKAWQESGLPPIRIGVNLSGRQFQQKGLIETVRRALGETRLSAEYLELELTESILMQKVETITSALSELDAMGIQISIDDFGTGYSSLSYLKRFPISKLKVDRSFVNDITTDPDDAAITAAIITMAHSLKLKVVAEGVETADQLAFLKSLKCDGMQGYLFSRPLPSKEATELLKKGTSLSPRSPA
ncbi:MAG: EAL domain-containing protein [Candidatus Manganitrophaceae bacterium]|nr:MAG: EAL domain-containing protein [Candidatus Manganitrophaceae bacterium]